MASQGFNIRDVNGVTGCEHVSPLRQGSGLDHVRSSVVPNCEAPNPVCMCVCTLWCVAYTYNSAMLGGVHEYSYRLTYCRILCMKLQLTEDFWFTASRRWISKHGS